ncbi:right-handed parallel beta-helix repeat-containing protein, partial [Mailhella sp.]|uniref:right-handed parallel beta-helix repeat-containing protein n=1 Tax=Mailhella sp. TaxID=1981029 RepID=UPI0040633C1C
MLTKSAIGNLVNRYKAVLAKCNLINTFGSLAVASMLVLGGAGVAGAATYTERQVLSNAEFSGDTFSVKYDKTTDSHDHGGALYLTGTSNKITNSIFTENVLVPDNPGNGLVFGAGIYSHGGTVTVDTCQFLNNKIYGRSNAYGAAIANSGGTLTIINSTFDGNIAIRGDGTTDGYGSAIFNSGTMTITGSTFKNSDGARAVYNSAGTATLSGNTFENNIRGCVQTEAAASAIFEGVNKFSNNGGDAIKNKGTSTFTEGSSTTFKGNDVDIDNK